jgi:hypothetical protein
MGVRVYYGLDPVITGGWPNPRSMNKWREGKELRKKYEDDASFLALNKQLTNNQATRTVSTRILGPPEPMWDGKATLDTRFNGLKHPFWKEGARDLADAFSEALEQTFTPIAVRSMKTSAWDFKKTSDKVHTPLGYANRGSSGSIDMKSGTFSAHHVNFELEDTGLQATAVVCMSNVPETNVAFLFAAVDGADSFTINGDSIFSAPPAVDNKFPVWNPTDHPVGPTPTSFTGILVDKNQPSDCKTTRVDIDPGSNDWNAGEIVQHLGDLIEEGIWHIQTRVSYGKNVSRPPQSDPEIQKLDTRREYFKEHLEVMKQVHATKATPAKTTSTPTAAEKVYDLLLTDAKTIVKKDDAFQAMLEEVLEEIAELDQAPQGTNPPQGAKRGRSTRHTAIQS